MASDEIKHGEGRGQVPPPKCKAFLLCQHAIIEAKTSRHSIINILNNLTVPHCPIVIPPMHAFIQLTDGIGSYEISLDFQDIDQGVVMRKGIRLKVTFPERLLKMNIIIPIPPLRIPHAGIYEVVIFADEHEIERQKFAAVIEPKGQANAPPGDPAGH
jgi:hypothetical protein